MTTDGPSRRRFLLHGVGGSVALGLAQLGGLSCARREVAPTSTPDPTPQPEIPGAGSPFDVVEVAGTHREIGRALGEACRESIAHVWQTDDSFASVRDASRGDSVARIQAMETATRARFPALMEELEGIAEGASVEMGDLFAWNCRAELSVNAETCPPGCSTVGLVRENGTMILAHNEDGGEVYEGRMVILRATAPSGLSFVALVYPGTIAGNGPGLNSRGVVQTTNYISCCTPAEGIPKYMIGRAILEAGDLEEAVAIATTDGRAFPWHHNIASLRDARLISLETWPERHSRREVTGSHVHTNHLVHNEMEGLSERADYLERSSRPRFTALQRLVEDHPFESREDLLAALGDRSGSPCRVCRQQGDEVPGMTVATAVYESPTVEVTVSEGPPCLGGEAMIYRP